jgi:predicted nicotinamide N-methyase
MLPNTVLQTFNINHEQVNIFVPVPHSSLPHFHSPYWAKVWPAALGLCYFLQDHLHYIQQKKITEIAAGLGLPSIFAAPHAAQVHCTDIEPMAIEMVQQSVLHNKINNVHCSVADWNDFLQMEIPDTILLSDVNYEPEQFNQLLIAINYYLKHHCTVILSSPQRLMAKPFIAQLLPSCIQQEEVIVKARKSTTAVSIFVLSTAS